MRIDEKTLSLRVVSCQNWAQTLRKTINHSKKTKQEYARPQAYDKPNRGGNFEASKLAYTRNVLNRGRLSLFVGAMMAVLFVFSIVGCTPYHAPDSLRSNDPEKGISASDSTKNGGVNVGFTYDTEDVDMINYELNPQTVLSFIV